MTPREAILEQIHHRETKPVPFTLGFEGDVDKRLDEHYGDRSWRERLTPYMSVCGGIDRRKSEPIGNGLERDLFGTVWRTDRRPFHMETPGLEQPSLEGYTLPPVGDFVDPQFQEKARERIREHPDLFSRIGMGWGLWESYWGIRGFENAMMDCIAEPDFFAEMLDRLTDLYLEQVAQCADVPADAIMFGDDWGGQRGVLMGPERWRRFFKPRYARIYEAAHAQGKVEYVWGETVR